MIAAEKEHARSSETRGDGKFACDVHELVIGEPKVAALGLDEYMKFDLPSAIESFRNFQDPKVEAIEAEFKRAGNKLLLDGKTLWDWYDYVRNQAASNEAVQWGDRDTGHDGMRLDDFLEMPQATRGKLRREHVLALRLYTCTPISFELNAPLRTFMRDENGKVRKPMTMLQAHTFPITIAVLNEAIKRLRDAEGQAAVTLWRGLKNMQVSNDLLLAGGVEMAPMSASHSLETALRYSHSPHSIIIKFVTRSFMERGADLEWISVFPGEKECLFPPLTFLSPTGRTQKVGSTFTVVEVAPRL